MAAKSGYGPAPVPAPAIPLLILLALAAILLAVALDQVKVRNGEHAPAKHGADAGAIHRCLDANGPAETWQFTSWRRPNHYIQTCQLDDGRWGLRIIQKVKNGWRERSSFIVKDGTYQQLFEYITARARPVG